MALRQLLLKEKSPILKRWLNLIAGAHPAGESPFKKSKDPFSNPQGYVLSHETDSLFHELLQDKMDSEKVCSSLDKIIRIKAVQDMTPGQAVAFIFLLKEAIVEELADEIEKRNLFGQWLELETRLDRLATLAFDIYMQCREKLCQLRINEIKADREIAYRILKRTGNLVTECSDVTE